MVKVEAAKTTTIEAYGDDMGGGASYCGSCNARVPEPYYVQLYEQCKGCKREFTDIVPHVYDFGGSDFP